MLVGQMCLHQLFTYLALEIISSVGPSYGAHINLPKCDLWSLSEVSSTDIFNPVIPRAVDGTALLGTAVGSDQFIVSVVRNRLVKIDDLLSKIRSLEDAQLEYVLLRSCAGLPKFIHVMRTTSPQSLGPTLLEMDSLLEEACRSIMGNCALLDRELDKLRLPISYGGCGRVLSALWLAQPAFIASTSQSLVLQSALTVVLDIAPRAKLDSLLDRHQRDIPAQFHVTADDLMNTNEPQELLSNQIFRRVFEVLEATTVSPREGNLLVASRAESGSRLFSTPQTGFGTVMNSKDFRILLKRRISISIFPNEIGCPR